MSHTKAETLSGALFEPRDWVRSTLLVVTFSLLTALSAQIVVPLPFTPVPVTMQTFAVLLTGALLGSRLGALTMLLYLAEGAAGLPYFSAGRGGLHFLLVSPTAGYLFAYPAAAFVTGFFAERGWDRRLPTAIAAMLLGAALIFLGGWAWLSVWTGSAAQAFRQGVAPFLIGDALKVLLAAAALPAGWRLLRLFRGSVGER